MTCLQQAGECIFVPAGWNHTVINLALQTLSINHNWITTANIDLVWDVMITEMQDIQTELEKWDDHVENDETNNNQQPHSHPEALESMLLGCVGLNVTAFVLMLLLGITNCLQRNENSSSQSSKDSIKMDLERLGDMLHVTVHVRSDELRLQKRLEASLRSKDLSILVLQLANTLYKQITN
jgi:Mg2+ and Co2+ transporter CorA